MAEGEKPRVDPSSYMTDRMVADRCMRMWRHGQWKRLHDFCGREPRARSWTESRIAQIHAVSTSDARVQDLYGRLAADKTPKLRLDSLPPGGSIAAEDRKSVV